jgi:hypothetical protein
MKLLKKLTKHDSPARGSGFKERAQRLRSTCQSYQSACQKKLKT